jgi:hypothetical protein
VNSMLHSFMSFSAILLWSSAVVLLSAVDICRDSFALLVCLGLLFNSLRVNVEWGEATDQGASIPSRGRLYVIALQVSRSAKI